MKVTKLTKAYKLIPVSLIHHIELLNKFSFGGGLIQKRLRLYEKFLSVRDKAYLEVGDRASSLLGSGDCRSQRNPHTRGCRRGFSGKEHCQLY
jgi:hypothetical protein